MPIYAYRCEACGHEHDALQKLSDPPLVDCPACGAPALKKQLTAAAFRLKGAGWYETDFKKDGKRNLHESGDAAPDAATGADAAKGKDKPDGKPAEAKAGGDGAASAATKPADAPASTAAKPAPKPSASAAPKPAGSPPPKAAAS